MLCGYSSPVVKCCNFKVKILTCKLTLKSCICFSADFFSECKKYQTNSSKVNEEERGRAIRFPAIFHDLWVDPAGDPLPTHIRNPGRLAAAKRTIFRKFKKEKSGRREGRCELNWVEIIMMNHHLGGRGGLLRRADPDFRPLTCHRNEEGEILLIIELDENNGI